MNDNTPLSQNSNHEADLAAKQEALKQTQDQIASLSLNATSLQNEIAGLQAKIRDIQQATAGYDRTSASLQQTLDGAKKSIEEKNNVSLAVLKDMKNKIDEQVKSFDQALDTQEAQVKKAADDAQAAASDSSAAADLLRRKQESYQSLRSVPTNTESALKEVTTLIDQAAKAETQSDYAAMYFLLKEAKRLSESITIPTPDDLANSLATALDEIDKAKADEASKKANAEKLQSLYANAKQALNAAKKTRTTDLLASLKILKTSPTAGAVVR